MGRYRDLWTSGKFLLKKREEEDKAKQQSAFAEYRNHSPEIALTDGSNAVLNALKSRRGPETGRWLKEITPTAQPQSAATADGGNAFQDMVVWMDALFNEFVDLAYEFNKSAVGTDFLISCMKPAFFERSTSDEWYRSVARVYQGRLTTKQWTIVVKGGSGNISVYLLPVAMWLAFTAGQVSEKDYPPFMELQRSTETNAWRLGGEPISLATIKSLAKELLGDLIRVSTGVMGESELFSPSTDLPRFCENIAVGYKQTAAPTLESNQDPCRSKVEATISMPDACDIVDGIIDRELERLYVQAVALTCSSDNAHAVRTQISAVEEFRLRMLQAFEEYAELTLPLAMIRKEAPPAAELMS